MLRSDFWFRQYSEVTSRFGVGTLTDTDRTVLGWRLYDAYDAAYATESELGLHDAEQAEIDRAVDSILHEEAIMSGIYSPCGVWHPDGICDMADTDSPTTSQVSTDILATCDADGGPLDYVTVRDRYLNAVCLNCLYVTTWRVLDDSWAVGTYACVECDAHASDVVLAQRGSGTYPFRPSAPANCVFCDSKADTRWVEYMPGVYADGDNGYAWQCVDTEACADRTQWLHRAESGEIPVRIIPAIRPDAGSDSDA